jgi:predicted permease
MPVFLVIGLGFFLKSIRILNEPFVNTAVKFNFMVSLPIMLFNNIYTAKLEGQTDPKLFIFTFLAIAGSVMILWLIVPRFVKNRKKASAMIHTMFRSNFLLLGFPLAINMFGQSNISAVSYMIPIVIPTYNFFAVILLAAFDDNAGGSRMKRIGSTIISILKNPLIIASAAAVLCQLIPLRLPGLIKRYRAWILTSLPPVMVSSGANIFRRSLKNTVPGAQMKQTAAL